MSTATFGPTVASTFSPQQLAARVRSARAAYEAAAATLEAARAEWAACDVSNTATRAANAAANANVARKACHAEYMTIDADYTARTAAALRSYEADIRFLKQYILHRTARSKAARAAYDASLSAALANRDSARAALAARTAEFEAARAVALTAYYNALATVRADCAADLAADRAAALTKNEPEIPSTKKYLVRRARRVNLARATYDADRSAARTAYKAAYHNALDKYVANSGWPEYESHYVRTTYEAARATDYDDYVFAGSLDDDFAAAKAATYEADRAAALADCDDALVTAHQFYKIALEGEAT